MTIRWNGGRVRALIHEAAADGLQQGAEEAFEATQREVPTDTGDLKRSGRLTVDRDTLHAEISYGEGLPDKRASVVHERLDIHHNNGSAKYLEVPTRSSGPQVLRALARSIRRRLG